MYCSSKLILALEELPLFIILLSQLSRFLTVESSDSEFDFKILCEERDVLTDLLFRLSELPFLLFISMKSGCFALGTITAKIWFGVRASCSLFGNSLNPKTLLSDSNIIVGDKVLFGGDSVQGPSKL